MMRGRAWAANTGKGAGVGAGEGAGAGRAMRGAGAGAHVIMYLSLSSLRMLRPFCISALAASTLAPAVEDR